MHPYGDKVTIETEKSLGEEPPRADYLVLVKDKDVSLEKEIFKIFRSVNIIEYKNPHDSLNLRVLHKICGYAHLLIGTAEHEEDISPDQVTVSIFRSKKTAGSSTSWKRPEC